MRDPARIDKLLKLFEEYWRKHPDYRFCQIVGNFFRGDPYFVEDDLFIERLEKYLILERMEENEREND